MSILHRARTAVDILLNRPVATRSMGGALPSKRAPMLWPDMRDGEAQWQMIDYAAYVEEGYNLNTLVYSAINYKARAISMAHLRAYEGNLDQPTLLKPEHPLSKLVSRPNPWQSWREFQMLRLAYLNLAGNAYTYLERPTPGALPTALYLLPPDRTFLIPKNGVVSGYLYVPPNKTRRDGVPFVYGDVMHHKLPNPGDPFGGMGYGLSPLSSLAMSGDVDNSVTRFLKKFFDRGTLFAGLLKFNIELTKERIGEIKERWREVYGGEENWGEVGVLDALAEYQRVSPTFDEMGFESIDERNETRILGPFGVPPILIGARSGLQHGTYANYETARKACWEDTLVPELRLFEAEDQYYLTSPDGGFVKYDLSDIPALRKDVKALTEAAHKLWMMGVPAVQALNTVGLEVGEFDGGDKPFGGRQRAPAPAQPSPAPQGDTTPPLPDNDGAANATDEERSARNNGKTLKASSWATERKERVWKSVDGISQEWEGTFATAAASCFDHDKREVLALVGEAKRKAHRSKATVDWTALETDIVAYLEKEGAEHWRETFIPLLEGVVEETGTFWATELGLDFSLRSILGEAWFSDYKLTFAQPISTTSSEGMHDVIAQAMAEGWSIDTLQTNLGQMFQQWSAGDLTADDFAWFEKRMPPHRTEAIARTETVRIAAAGTVAELKDWNIEQKEWIASLDDRCRASHKDANGQVQPVDEPFTLNTGAQLMYPCDGSLGAPVDEVVNCRCGILPVIPD